ncbi:MarR family winged helix-turn-helix transcriptional regulator [Kutzneria sp. CA-103260]|uniref:MarR family winged helix-turn-helix transcriptional regulator n=1 Tax=Kutzneria sp. CA-103260 TaxID=2802641 RepID=UPI001BA89E9D|nr:MarR family transcriptional regulator [Kutzneria sp. CA-103260]QUQ63311.1 MarR family protein [Kutzneria sp. CA-103260]
MVHREEVEGLVAALFVVNNGLTRAAKQRPKASELRLLQAVAMHEGSRPSELAERLGVDRSLVTRQLRDLEDEGKVAVRPDPRDGRAFVAELTERGRQELTELTEFGMRRFEAFVADWDQAEVRELTRLLWKFEHSKAAVVEKEQEQRPERGRRRSRGDNE